MGSGGSRVFHKGLSGGDERQLGPDVPGLLEDWTRDGRYLVTSRNARIWAVPLADDSAPFQLTKSEGGEDEPQVSPDGRLLAYTSGESGTYEIYVQPFPHAVERVRVSVNGGVQPKWRDDGRELFYLTPQGDVMSVSVNVDGTVLAVGAPRSLFNMRIDFNAFSDQYDVTGDGERFLFLTPTSRSAQSLINVLLNWPALFSR
jgi:Tol biopolymer transport system component